ncbi:YchJ family protein [Agaribacter flavus]|uniref:YchJ family protein n=1 Tax=Agaribacter flavus TaxID=1902781 RepID=A0ABV7FKN7_9ALTE
MKLHRSSQTNTPCPCGSVKQIDVCCLPLINGTKFAESAEQLMRSRFVAFKIQSYRYVVDTYCQQESTKLNENAIRQSNEGTKWLSLDVLASDINTVEFKAWYQVGKSFYVLHETSNFVLENKQWRYTDGYIHKDSGEVKPKRNDQCLCGSAKKFKKCCGS